MEVGYSARCVEAADVVQVGDVLGRPSRIQRPEDDTQNPGRTTAASARKHSQDWRRDANRRSLVHHGANPPRPERIPIRASDAVARTPLLQPPRLARSRTVLAF